MSIFEMSVSGAVLISIIFFIRKIFLHRLSKKVFIVLWLIVLSRLIVPVSIPASFSFYTWFPKSFTSFQEENNDFFKYDLESNYRVGNKDYKKNYRYNDNNHFFERNIQPSETNFTVSPLIITWISGTFIFANFFAFVYIKSKKIFNKSTLVNNSFIKEWQNKNKLIRDVEIRESAQISTPLSYGLIKPVILIPKNLNKENTVLLEYILTHENVHIKHFDILLKFLMITALCIHWFNPMVWIMYILFNRDIELSCDETVVNIFGEKSRSSYANCLIDMSSKKDDFMPLCNCFSKNAIKERMVSIMKTKKNSIISLVIAVFIILGVTTIFATSKQTENVNSKIKKQNFNGTSIEKGPELTKDEYAKLYKEYEEYGLKYDKNKDCFYYNSKLVRNFIDVTKSNGESFDSGKFSGSLREINNPEGEIDVYAFRDYEKTNEKGEGILLGIKPGFFDEDTYYKKTNQQIKNFSKEEINKISALKFIGYEKNSISEFQDKVWKKTDTKEYQELLERISKNHDLLKKKDSDDLASFVYYELIPLTSEKRKNIEFGGYEETDYKDVSDNAILEYSFIINIKKPEALTVEQYKDIRSDIKNKITSIMPNKTVDQLQDEAYMNKEIKSEIKKITNTYNNDKLQISLEYIYKPLSGLKSKIQKRDSFQDKEQLEKRKYPNATKEDYDSLLSLKTPNYQAMSVSAFNKKLMEWSNTDYERAERIGEDYAYRDYNVRLSEEEIKFVELTVWYSNLENAELVRSIHSQKKEEDLIAVINLSDKETSKNGISTCCKGEYRISYHIKDKNNLSIGERDRLLEKTINDIQRFWENSETEELIKMNKKDLENKFREIASLNDNEKIKFYILKDQVNFDYESSNEIKEKNR